MSKKGIMSVLDYITSFGGKLPIPVVRLFRYVTSGILTIFINLVILLSFVEIMNIYYVYSAAFAYFASHSTHYIINKNWAFKDTSSKFMRGYLYFFGFGILTTFLVAFFLKFIVENFGFNYVIGQFVIVAIFSVFNFIMNYMVTFKKTSEIKRIFLRNN